MPLEAPVTTAVPFELLMVLLHRALGRLARSAWRRVLGHALLDLARFGALSSTTPLVSGRRLWNSVNPTEFFDGHDPYHVTLPVQDRDGRHVLLVADWSAACWLHRCFPLPVLL